MRQFFTGSRARFSMLGVSLFWAAAVVTGTVVSSPFWGPASLVDDGRQRVG